MSKRLIAVLLVLLILVFLPSTALALPVADAPFTWGTGADGDMLITAGTTYNIHTTNHSGRSCANGGDGVSYEVIGLTAKTATLKTSPAGGCLNVGDEVMLINLQGSSGTTGNYELLRVQNLSANLVTFTTNKTRFYGANAGDDSGLGSTQHVVLQRVPNYNNVTINGNLVANSWDGTRYGLLVFKVKGNWVGSGTINLDGAGYRGGKKGVSGAYQGESWPGPGMIFEIANGGGGAGRNNGNTGCPGGEGNYGGGVLNPSCASPSGNEYGAANLNRIYLGSGGGGRDVGNGGRGGGAVYVMANNANFLGSIVVRGQKGESTGGGSGGSIRIEGGKIAVGALNAIGDGTAGPVRSGLGRIALYYGTTWSSSSANPTPYTQKVAVGPTTTATRSQTPDVGKTGTAISLTLTAQGPSRTPDLGKTGTAISLTLTAQAPSRTPDLGKTATSIVLTLTAGASTNTPNYNATATADALTATTQAGTPDYNATGTALALTATAQAGTPDYNATGTADALTATAQAGTPDYNATGTALALTATAMIGTPDYNATATADALTATAQAGTPDYNATGTALAQTATALVSGSSTPDFYATATAMWLTATAQSWTRTPTITPTLSPTATLSATSSPSITPTTSGNDGTPTPNGGGGGNGAAVTITPTPGGGTPFGFSSGAVCAITLNVYVYVDSNLDGMMAAQGEGVNSLQVNFLDASFGKVGSAYASNGKATFCVPDYLKGLTLRVDIPYLQRTGTMQAPDDNNKNQPLEMWFRLEPPTLPLYIP